MVLNVEKNGLYQNNDIVFFTSILSEAASPGGHTVAHLARGVWTITEESTSHCTAVRAQ